jgi:4'-phosphopantetheinyl transferase
MSAPRINERYPAVPSTRLSAQTFTLFAQTIDVWPVHVAVSEPITARLLPLLDPDEAIRAARFRFDHLRHSFIISRGLLRVLLGRYLNIAPNKLKFSYGLKGKPSLAAPVDIKFNASHSGAMALFAFATGFEIGIDVEQIRPLQDMREIARRFFCSDETAELMSLSAGECERAFFHCWTRKEAYIKAVGDGLSVPLDSFCVTLRLDEQARFIHIGHDRDVAKAWTLHNIKLQSQYAAALAYRAAPGTVNVLPLRWPTELLELL